MDLGLDRTWGWSLGGRVVVIRGLSWSDKDWVLVLVVVLVFFDKSGGDLGGDLVDLQEMVNLLGGISLRGEVKKMGLFVSEEFTVK